MAGLGGEGYTNVCFSLTDYFCASLIMHVVFLNVVFYILVNTCTETRIGCQSF